MDDLMAGAHRHGVAPLATYIEFHKGLHREGQCAAAVVNGDKTIA
ncbi:hypothetical protein ACTXMW_16100 [Brachybacterium paraconglomeratum]